MAKTLRKGTLALICFILFLFPSNADSQEDTSEVSLISFLQKLELDFDIKFSYADDDIRDIRIVCPQKKNLKLY